MRRGLARDDVFAVGIELTMTESMTHCDVVLPAATHFEYADLYPSYGHHWLQRAEPVIPPLGESLPNTEIFRRLAARFGFDEPCFKATDEELMDDAVDAARSAAWRRAAERDPDRRALQMTGPDGKPLVLFDNVFPATPSGKIELKSETLASAGARRRCCRTGASGRLTYPLMLISPASDKRISSTLGGLARLAAGAAAADEPGGRRAGEASRTAIEVRVWNERGEVILPLEVTDDVPPGVVASEKGAWLATSRTGQTISALVSADIARRSRRRRLLQRHAGRGRTRVIVRRLNPAQVPAVAGMTTGDNNATMMPNESHRGSVVLPIRNSSTARAHWRPSRIAQTTSDWPRRMSPAANTLATDVR